MRRSLLLAVLTLAPAATPPAFAGAPQSVVVHLSNFKFTPATITLAQGQSYNLKLINDSGGGHSFGAKAFFAAANVAATDRAQIIKGAVEVGAGQTRTIQFTAPAPGTYNLKCTHMMHGPMGMRGQILVR
nr:cupredoxin domain-containing protein [uncultured Sphingomonas sp.]